MTDAKVDPLRTVVLKTAAVIRNAWTAAGTEVQILESHFHPDVHTPVGWTPAPSEAPGAAPAKPTSSASFGDDATALANLAGNLAQRAHGRIDDLATQLLNAVHRIEILESATEKPLPAASAVPTPAAPVASPAPESPPVTGPPPAAE